MRRLLIVIAALSLPGVGWGEGLTPAERESMQNTAASMGYMDANHKSDVSSLHACARSFGEKHGFAESRETLADAMLGCSAERDKFLSDCQAQFSLPICRNTAGLLLLHGATVDKPLPVKQD